MWLVCEIFASVRRVARRNDRSDLRRFSGRGKFRLFDGAFIGCAGGIVFRDWRDDLFEVLAKLRPDFIGNDRFDDVGDLLEALFVLL